MNYHTVNPYLTVCLHSTDHIGGYVYTNGRSNEAGYGRLNACRALSQTVASTVTFTAPQFVCTTTTSVYLNSVPYQCPIIWEFGPFLTMTSPQGSNPATFISTGSGATWIRPSVSAGCGIVNIATMNVFSGIPPMPEPISFAMDEPPHRFTCTTNGSAGATSYKWYKNGVLQSGFTTDVAIFNMTSPYCGHSYTIGIEAVNNCGISSRRNNTAIEPICGGGLLLSPNPASSFVDIKSDNSNVQNIIDPLSEIDNSKNESNAYLLSLTDLNGTIVFSEQFSSLDIRLFLANIKDGTYILTVTDRKEIWQDLLIIKH